MGEVEVDGRNAHIAKTLEKIPPYGGVVERMAAELEHSIRISSKYCPETFLCAAGQFPRVIKTAVNEVIGFLIRNGLRVRQTMKLRGIAKAGARQSP